MAFLKRRQQELSSQSLTPSEGDRDLAEAFPALVSYVTRDDYDDGSKRLTSSLTFFCDEGTVKAVLNDRDTGESLWASAAGLHSAMASLEQALSLGTGEWRRNKGQSNGRAKRRG